MMSPKVRRIVYVLAYEFFAVVLVGVGLAIILGRPVIDTGSFAIMSSLIAVAWNYVYTTGFEFWESRQTVKGRSRKRRAVHAVGFEVGLLLILAPFMAWWLAIPLIEAFLYDVAYGIMFVGYTYLFNLGFDSIFGLPESAR